MSRPSKKKQGRYLCAPLSVLIDDRLSKSERLVLMGLYSFHDYKSDRPVFPSRTVLAKRSDLNDATRVSKLTDSLSQKGWVTKKRKGFTNLIDYRLHVPAYVIWQMFGRELSKVAEITVMAESTIMAETTIPKVAETTIPEVAETTTTKEQTILTNHINKPHMGESELFDFFFEQYPKQVGRKQALTEWNKLNLTEKDLSKIIINITDRLTQGVWSLETKQFIPHPANYLSGEQWSDELISRSNHEQRNQLSAAEKFRANISSQ